jgi:hypothetical protein
MAVVVHRFRHFDHETEEFETLDEAVRMAALGEEDGYYYVRHIVDGGRVLDRAEIDRLFGEDWERRRREQVGWKAEHPPAAREPEPPCEVCQPDDFARWQRKHGGL